MGRVAVVRSSCRCRRRRALGGWGWRGWNLARFGCDGGISSVRILLFDFDRVVPICQPMVVLRILLISDPKMAGY